MSTFTVKVNNLLGKREWVAKPQHYDFLQEIARCSYADMLHDQERNIKYFFGINKAIRARKENDQSTRVLDIGTGTGLLAMMAAHCKADSVVACEMFHPVGRCAVDIIKDNGFEEKIKIIHKSSLDLTVGSGCDLERRANILVAEVFDTELIGEGALSVFHHALRNLMEPDCIVIPSSATIYAQIIDSPKISQWNSIGNLEIDCTNTILAPEIIKSCPGISAVHDLQISQIPKHIYNPVSDAVSVFEFDFTGKKPIIMKETFVKQFHVKKEGSCHAIFMWWSLQMDPDIVLNNGPKWVQPLSCKAFWRDHWMQGIYYFQEPKKVLVNETVNICANHDAYSMWFTFPELDEKPNCICLAHVSNSRSKIAMNSDQERMGKYTEMLKNVITPSSVCLSIGDSSLLPLVAAKLGAKKIFSVETNSFAQKVAQSYIDTNKLQNVIRVLKKEATELEPVDLENEKIDVLFAEPYFANCLHPWDFLCFLHCRTALGPLLQTNATVIPQQGKIKAVAVQFENLWKIRAPVDNVLTFKVSKFDQMVQRAINLCDAAVEPHQLWEYPCNAVSEEFDVLSFDFSAQNVAAVVEAVGQQIILDYKKCNGVVLWVEYLFKDVSVSNGPIEPIVPKSKIMWPLNCEQGVHFLPKRELTDTNKNSGLLKYSLSINLNTGDISLKFDLIEN